MKARIFGLLKLLLQVVLFLLSGRWVRLGDERRAAAPAAESKRQREQAPGPPLQRRRVFDARRRRPAPLSTARSARTASEREQGSPSAAPAPRDSLTGQNAYALRQEGKGAYALRSASPAVPGHSGKARPRSLVATLRDRRALAESLTIGEALGPRRPPR